jgi:hypothetical protein
LSLTLLSVITSSNGCPAVVFVMLAAEATWLQLTTARGLSYALAIGVLLGRHDGHAVFAKCKVMIIHTFRLPANKLQAAQVYRSSRVVAI